MSSQELVRRAGGALTTDTEPAQRYARKSRAANTLRGYRADWNAWAAWATAHGAPVMPASHVDIAVWLAESAATHKPGTLGRRLASISVAHQLAGYPTPTKHPELRAVLRGIMREHGSAVHRKQPLLIDDLAAAVATCDDGLLGVRDRAILCLGWASAMRREEIAAIDVDHLEWTDRGLVITIPRSKTDRTAAGQRTTAPYAQQHPACCPVAAVADWMAEAEIEGGALFRTVRNGMVGGRITGETVALTVKRRMRQAGIPGDWAGHSLRAGLVTQAALNGVDTLSIAEQTRHRNLTQLQAYVRKADPWTRNAATGAGL